MKTQTQPKTCTNPACGKVLDPDEGRSDKKYCSNKCKSAHHNAETKKKQAFYTQQHKTLLRQEAILKELYESNLYIKTGVTAEVLRSRGFQHQYGIDHAGHEQTQALIRWFYYYGIEAKTSTVFFIHRRNPLIH